VGSPEKGAGDAGSGIQSKFSEFLSVQHAELIKHCDDLVFNSSQAGASDIFTVVAFASVLSLTARGQSCTGSGGFFCFDTNGS
jgi:hypothetical protein